MADLSRTGQQAMPSERQRTNSRVDCVSVTCDDDNLEEPEAEFERAVRTLHVAPEPECVRSRADDRRRRERGDQRDGVARAEPCRGLRARTSCIAHARRRVLWSHSHLF